MKLVKAMVKSPEQMHPDFVCCASQIEWILARRAEGPVILDISVTRPSGNCICNFCKYKILDENNLDVLVVESLQEGQIGGWAFMNQFDIDEGILLEEPRSEM